MATHAYAWQTILFCLCHCLPITLESPRRSVLPQKYISIWVLDLMRKIYSDILPITPPTSHGAKSRKWPRFLAPFASEALWFPNEAAYSVSCCLQIWYSLFPHIRPTLSRKLPTTKTAEIYSVIHNLAANCWILLNIGSYICGRLPSKFQDRWLSIIVRFRGSVGNQHTKVQHNMIIHT